MQPLDLYATIEPLIGFDAQYERLYARYLKELKSLHVKEILDIGCGNGTLLAHLKKEGFVAQGIERSPMMVQRAVQKGVNASLSELESFEEESFNAVLAVADVLNYIPDNELELFFTQVQRVLKHGGSFLADINTLYGFEAVAEGAMVKEEGDCFLSVDAHFEKPLLQTQITLFRKEKEHYIKEQGSITQYFHPISRFKKLKNFKLSKTYPITLFSEHDADKTLLHFVKTVSK